MDGRQKGLCDRFGAWEWCFETCHLPRLHEAVLILFRELICRFVVDLEEEEAVNIKVKHLGGDYVLQYVSHLWSQPHIKYFIKLCLWDTVLIKNEWDVNLRDALKVWICAFLDLFKLNNKVPDLQELCITRMLLELFLKLWYRDRVIIKRQPLVPPWVISCGSVLSGDDNAGVLKLHPVLSTKCITCAEV